MALWLLLAAMTGAAALSLLWPLARARDEEGAAPDDAGFYRAAMADIERDRSRGLIGEREAEAAAVEAARRLLRSQTPAKADLPRGEPVARRRMIASLLALVFAPLFALAVYSATGSPHLPDRPLAQRRGADPATLDVAEAVARIEAHLAANPGDGAGYEVVAPVYMRLGRLDDAVRAFAAALRLNGETPDRLASLGEALVARAGGIVSAEAKERFAQAAARDAQHPKARYYLAVARLQDGDRDGAIAAFEDLLKGAPEGAPWLGAVRERLAALRSPPVGGDAIAALPDAERAAAIRAMVDGLSERLATNGGSLEDWSRLIRSHMVLGARDKARQALNQARRALGAEANAPLDALAKEFGLQDS